MIVHNKYCNKSTFRMAGAFMAYVIGPGFATGQEILQFFTSYGYLSYGGILLSLIGYIFFSKTIFITGNNHKSKKSFNQFNYFCGKTLGAFYTWLHPISLIILMPVLVSGAGAVFSEYFSIDHYIGSAIIIGLVMYAYLTGFERLAKIVSTIVPVVIVLSILIGLIIIHKDLSNFVEIPKYEVILNGSQSSSNWMIGSILYLSSVFLGGSTYFTHIGISANSQEEAKYGAIIGTIIIVLAIAITNTAMLLNAESIYSLEIPMSFLAKKLSYKFGIIFSIVLLLGTFSSCSTMMWSVCSRFTWKGKTRNRIYAIIMSILVYVLGLLPFSDLVGVVLPFLGLLPFSDLVGVVLPFLGYLGLVFIGCILYKSFKNYRDSRYNRVLDSFNSTNYK